MEVEHPVLDVIRSRWSPAIYSPQPVETEKLLSILEAARWAPSSYNAQPWSFLVARKETTTAAPTGMPFTTPESPPAS